MLGSHGEQRKQRPYDEAVRVPFVMRWPALGETPRVIPTPLGSPDIMPTLLGLCGIAVPATVQGRDFSSHLRGGPPPDDAALIACYTPFGEWTRPHGGREYRGVRTERYTYVRSLDGPWLLFDNEADPYQMKNLCEDPFTAGIREELERKLVRKLRESGDDFRPGGEYVRRWQYGVDANGTMPYGL
jgi:arylsulfatase A-like enzyme